MEVCLELRRKTSWTSHGSQSSFFKARSLVSDCRCHFKHTVFPVKFFWSLLDLDFAPGTAQCSVLSIWDVRCQGPKEKTAASWFCWWISDFHVPGNCLGRGTLRKYRLHTESRTSVKFGKEPPSPPNPM